MRPSGRLPVTALAVGICATLLFGFVALVVIRGGPRDLFERGTQAAELSELWSKRIPEMTRQDYERALPFALSELLPGQEVMLRWQKFDNGKSWLHLIDSEGRIVGGSIANHMGLDLSMEKRWELPRLQLKRLYEPTRLRALTEQRMASVLPGHVDVMSKTWRIENKGSGYIGELTYSLGVRGAGFLDRPSEARLTIDSEGDLLRFEQGGPFPKFAATRGSMTQEEALPRILSALNQRRKGGLLTEDTVVVVGGWVEQESGGYRFLWAGRQKDGLRASDWETVRAGIGADELADVALVDGISGEVRIKEREPFWHTKRATEEALNWKWPE